jgi:hypothetical protein
MHVGDLVPPPAPPASAGSASLGELLLAAAVVGGVAAGIVGLIKLATAPRPTASKAERDSIERAARRLSSKFPVVCADHIKAGCRPPLKNGHRPDVYAASFDGREHIEEHETMESVGKRHSVEQDRAFRRWAARGPRRTYRQVVTY